ncbi:uncharacterized protein LOC18434435 [Amborella trichopoda]|uniref:Sacsin/Nov domain-containing protein n=1 Tax=Amborella trichopoda TaxID=13333 RepID=W1PE65_AMBTC|nr:uncharacterized protein LOC18434435 [Amborella trichopoda]ERN06243.1 hypothetical protein AMTR_s00016p00193450 [Amborella trichopoda]|eukprot:XP_006844568.1 uncharacterized protein LOC18434435 [Amborella trichopoda]
MAKTPESEHIEEIRTKKFSIGREPNPLTEDLHHAVRNLSAELYSKDIHFLMELIQNAEDNTYEPGVDPSLEFLVTSNDITKTGASSTLLVFNNEKGFSRKNIESICSVGRSTKAGNRQSGYIGEKGIGFKSVFLVSSQAYIFSNGYQISFNEEPNPDCKIGYIVPEWVEEKPTLSDVHELYGSDKLLPTTTIILPLKPDKVAAVKNQLSIVHPELLLFLSKIKQLSVREHNADPKLNTVSSISISSETSLQKRKNINAECYALHLSVQENGVLNECRYHIWRQRFPVKPECKVERRMDIEEWVISLAFPFGKRINRGSSSAGIYAFLPTEMVTNLPFIIQADFILPSSRESIVWENKWNKGILDCVPTSFFDAFYSYLKSNEAAPPSSLSTMFKFLPVKESPFSELNNVRDSIRKKVISEEILPCESFSEQQFFCKPNEAGRLLPVFWDILFKAQENGVCLQSVMSHGMYVISSAFDQGKFDDILEFLGVGFMKYDWYGKCIRSSDMVSGVSEGVYMELLCFLADNWADKFAYSNFKNVPILKYIDLHGRTALCNLDESSSSWGKCIYFSSAVEAPWLIKWNQEFGGAAGCYLMPEVTQTTLRGFQRSDTLLRWLRQYANVDNMSTYKFAFEMLQKMHKERKIALSFAHFLYHSFSKNFLHGSEVVRLCQSMPLVDNYGSVTTSRNGILVPSAGSKWAKLMVSNPWRGEGYIELSEDYIRSGSFGGIYTSENQLLEFVKTCFNAVDIPELRPPNAKLPTSSSPLMKENALLLLEWIRNLQRKGISIPERFLTGIREGSWLKTSLSFKAPKESFLSSSEWGNLLQMGNVLVDIPLIDENFYDYRISSYKGELSAIGVMVEYGEACRFIANRLMSLSDSSTLTRSHVFSMLGFIRYLGVNYNLPDEFMGRVREGKWLKTSSGYRLPVGSVLSDPKWESFSQISKLPLIDEVYYGEEIRRYKSELRSLGVVVGFNQEYQLVMDNLCLPAFLITLTRDSVLSILECIRNSRSSDALSRKLRGQQWLRTTHGFMAPHESFLYDSTWGCLNEIVDGVALIEEHFYGSDLCYYKEELGQLGVITSLEHASKQIALRFKSHLSSLGGISKDNALSLLKFLRYCKECLLQNPQVELMNCIVEQKWVKTTCGYRTPRQAILFSPQWDFISKLAVLPFIDDSHYGNCMSSYREELKDMGAVVEFERGARFVAKSLKLPKDPTTLAPAHVFSLLHCIRLLLKEFQPSLPEEFMRALGEEKWLKTYMGYKSPNGCLLYDSLWEPLLQPEDGPFIDEAFYGSQIVSFKEELRRIGVNIDPTVGCSLVVNHLKSHSENPAIVRIYKYLHKFNWSSEEESTSWIWIPNGDSNGEWVKPAKCALHDKDNLFGSRFHVLDKLYEKNLLSFFSLAFGVVTNPKIEDYCELWKTWEDEDHLLTLGECSCFWASIVRHWNLRTEKLISNSIMKLPKSTDLGSIKLCDKREVFIPDDLQLKDLFSETPSGSVIVWYPQFSMPSIPLTKLFEIYSIIGVKAISKSVRKDESSMSCGTEFRKAVGFIRKGLIRMVLGYLANPSLVIAPEDRHQMAKSLLQLTVFEMDEPITVFCFLPISADKSLSVQSTRMVRWEKDSSRLLVQLWKKEDQKSNIEFATYFAEAVSKGLLWDKTELVDDLLELIKVGFLLQYDVNAVDFLLKTKNLQLFEEDEQFLSSAFPSD